MADHPIATTTPGPKKPQRRHARLARVLFSISEAAGMLGTKADALRRTIERHAVAEGEELVARLNHGVVARRRKDLGRWSVHLPPALLG